MRALVVEDEPRLATGLRNGLEAEGYAVDVALTGTDGLWFAREHGYDVVLLDLMLPELDGFEICATLRAERVWTPILMLTARDADTDQVRALDTGADDYLTKPFSFVVLVARLRALVRRDPAPRPAVLEAAGVVLDPAAHRVEVDGSEVLLAPREFLLLEHLLRAHPAVVPKEDLLLQVWGDLDDANVVEVYVGYLRRKLGRTRSETVRGVGYRMAT